MGSPAGRQGHDAVDAHQAKKASRFASNDSAWSVAIWSVSSAGSSAPSSTMARTWVGKSWA